MGKVVGLYNPESIWPYIVNPEENRFEGNDIEKEYFKAVKKFGELCSVKVMTYAVSDSKNRPLFPEYTESFDLLTKEFLSCIEENRKISLPNIGNDLKSRGFSSDTINAICYGDISEIGSQFGPNSSMKTEEYLSAENRTKIVSQYVACLNALKKQNIDLPLEYDKNHKTK